MPIYVWLAAAMVVAAIPVLWWAFRSDHSTSSLVRTNLGDMTPVGSGPIVSGGGRASTDALVDSSAALARRFTPAGQIDHLEKRLIAAGLDRRWTLERVLAVKVALGGGALFFGIIQAASTGKFAWVLLGAAAGAGLYWLPDLQIGGKANARSEEIELQLPDVIDQITVTVEAGLGFDSAMRRVSQTSEGPVVDEFSRVLQDIHLGFPRDEALQAMSERSDVTDLRLFASAIVQAGRYGISIADVLRAQSAELREKRSYRAEERAQKVPVKIVVPLVLCILPVLFIVLIGPGILRIADSGIGG